LAPTHDDQQHVPGPSLWPVGFAVGIVVLLVGLVVSYLVVAVGAVIALVFAFLWVRDLTAGTALAQAPEVAPENAAAAERALEPASPEERYPRAKFLELSTLGLGGVIGGLVSVPAFGFMIVPSLLKQGFKDHDVGPLTDAYSLTSDWDNQWLTGGLEPDVITEAHLDKESIFAGIQRFAHARRDRLDQQLALLNRDRN